MRGGARGRRGAMAATTASTIWAADVGDARRQHARGEREDRERELSGRLVVQTSSSARRL